MLRLIRPAKSGLPVSSLDFREPPQSDGPQTVVLTYEFAELDRADAAAKDLRAFREHVEGPYPYG